MNEDLMRMMAKVFDEGNNSEKNRANLPNFGTERAALDYAKRIAQLKPGDTVLYGYVGEALKKGVFHGLVSEGRKAFVLYMDAENEIGYVACPLGALWFPDMKAKA